MQDEDGGLESLTSELAAAGFDETAVLEAVRGAANAEAAALNIRRRARSDPLARLLALLVLGDPVGLEDAPRVAAQLAAADLIEHRGEFIHARARLTPHEGLLVAHDLDQRAGDAEYVPGVNNAARTLASLTVREPVERALDVGTGCGIQALLAARHSRDVVATDVSARALGYADLNRRLNGAKIVLRQGSWFEPVVDDTFELIVANPPFVISPESRYVFRDSGRERDTVSREVVRGAAAHLAEGGYATVLCNWACGRGEHWSRPLESWTEGIGCDALLLGDEPVDPLHYASRWNEPLRGERTRFEQTVERWLDYYEAQGIAALGIGAVVLRRRSGENWRCAYDLAAPVGGNAGPHLLRLFRARDLSLSDTALLDSRFALVPGHRLHQELVYETGYALRHVTMTLDEGVGLVAPVDVTALEVLFALDPERPLGAAIAAVDAEPASVIPAFRRLYELGFVSRLPRETHTGGAVD
jgi:methylase of polypeptide subunit release factors